MRRTHFSWIMLRYSYKYKGILFDNILIGAPLKPSIHCLIMIQCVWKTHECAIWHIETETKLPPFRRRRFQTHFLEWISIKITLKFVPNGPIDEMTALLQIMAWHSIGDKPLSEPIMAYVPTHICVTRPQWVLNAVAQWRHIPSVILVNIGSDKP